jgi:uncharacterized transporter YbjL
MVSNTILFTGIVALGLLILLFSSVLLPPTKLLIVLLIIVVIVAILLRTFFVRIYSRAQVAIRETLNREVASHSIEKPKSIPGLPDDIEMISVFLTDQSIVIGKTIRDTGLREKSGASIVAVKRDGTAIVNPTPSLELRLGDELLLLGGPVQFDAARKLME